MRIIFKTCFSLLCFLISISELDGKCPKALPVTRGNGINPCSGKVIHTGNITTKKVSSRKRKRKYAREDIKLNKSDYRIVDRRRLEELRELHDMQMELITNGSRLSRNVLSRLKRDIKRAGRDVYDNVRSAEGFPYLNELGTLHEYAERIHKSGKPAEFRNLTKQEILARLQSAQINAYQKYIDSEAFDRKYERLNED